MRYQHKSLEVQNLRVYLEVIGDSLMKYYIPDSWVLLVFSCVEANTITPEVPDLTNIDFH